jgi:hypothetical protein
LDLSHGLAPELYWFRKSDLQEPIREVTGHVNGFRAIGCANIAWHQSFIRKYVLMLKPIGSITDLLTEWSFRDCIPTGGDSIVQSAVGLETRQMPIKHTCA